jgi:LL-H family phage holin
MQISDTQTIAFLTALAPFLVSLATSLYRLFLSRLPENKQMLLMTVARTAVQAAEQMGDGGAGTAKKKIAEEAVNAALKSLGLAINPVFADAAIESLVFAMNQEKSQQAIVQTPTTSKISG